MLSFLTSLYDKGLGYSAMGTARSAISTFIRLCSDMHINSFECVTSFMKGIFNERLALPRYQVTWDVGIVLKYIKNSTNTTLFQLSCNLCMLFLLLTAQRCQT